MARKAHALQTIAEQGQTPVAKQEIVQQMLPALQAKGFALAATVIAEATGQAGAWTRYYRDMLELSPEGRKAFRTGIAQATARPKGPDGKPTSLVMNDNDGNEIPNSEAIAKGARNSARSRLSEFMQISKALDDGFEFLKEWSHHTAVGYARVMLRTKAASGASTRGRKPTPAVEKVKNYLIKHAQEVGGLWEVAKIVNELINAPEPMKA